MGARQFAGDRQAEPAAAGAGRAEKRTKQIFLRLGRQAGAVIGDLDRDRSALTRCRKAQLARTGLERVAGEVREDAVELVAIGPDRELGRDRAFDRKSVF